MKYTPIIDTNVPISSKHCVHGYTLIELLIVIAIIGILSTIVIAGVSTSRQSARDISSTAEMNSLAYEAMLYYRENNRSYNAVCNDPEIVQLLKIAKAPQTCPSGECTGGCSGNGQQYRAHVQLRSGLYYCVDSKRFADTLSTQPTGNTCQ